MKQSRIVRKKKGGWRHAFSAEEVFANMVPGNWLIILSQAIQVLHPSRRGNGLQSEVQQNSPGSFLVSF